MPRSGKKKPAVWLRKIEDNKAHLVLRRNFEEKMETDDDGEEKTYWQYEEVETVVPNRSDVVKWAEENFDTAWYSNPVEQAKKLTESD